jgi:hypothetical protein
MVQIHLSQCLVVGCMAVISGNHPSITNACISAVEVRRRIITGGDKDSGRMGRCGRPHVPATTLSPTDCPSRLAERVLPLVSRACHGGSRDCCRGRDQCSSQDNNQSISPALFHLHLDLHLPSPTTNSSSLTITESPVSKQALTLLAPPLISSRALVKPKRSYFYPYTLLRADLPFDVTPRGPTLYQTPTTQPQTWLKLTAMAVLPRRSTPRSSHSQDT